VTQVSEPYAGFELVTALRHEIAVLIRRHTEVIRNLGAEAQRTRWLTKLEELAALVEGDTFKVLIVGQFSRARAPSSTRCWGRRSCRATLRLRRLSSTR
jgi:hypothetical protein